MTRTSLSKNLKRKTPHRCPRRKWGDNNNMVPKLCGSKHWIHQHQEMYH